MKGLVIKDMLSAFKGLKTILALSIIIVMAAATNNTEMFMMLPIFISLPVTMTISVDEQCGWQNFALGLPFDRRSIVRSKYVIVLIAVLFASVLVGAIYTAFGMIKGDFELGKMIVLTIGSLMAGLAYPTFFLPLNYKFSSANARTIFIVLTTAFAGILTSLMGEVYNSPSVTSTIDVPSSGAAGSLIIAAVSLILYLISMFISTAIYEKREL